MPYRGIAYNTTHICISNYICNHTSYFYMHAILLFISRSFANQYLPSQFDYNPQTISLDELVILSNGEWILGSGYSLRTQHIARLELHTQQECCSHFFSTQSMELISRIILLMLRLMKTNSQRVHHTTRLHFTIFFKLFKISVKTLMFHK